MKHQQTDGRSMVSAAIEPTTTPTKHAEREPSGEHTIELPRTPQATPGTGAVDCTTVNLAEARFLCLAPDPTSQSPRADPLADYESSLGIQVASVARDTTRSSNG